MIIDGNIITPEDGKKLTNGRGVYSFKVFLGKNDSPTNWYEVDVDAEEIDPGAEATAEDYAAALSELGVSI